MSTPTLPQARRQYDAQRGIVVAALRAIRRLFAADPKPSIERIAATAAGYQLAAATVSSRHVASYASAKTPLTKATAFAGVSSLGFPLTEPIIATIDARVPAPVEPLPQSWWDDASVFMADLERLLLSEIQDAGRTASQVEAVGRGFDGYIRMLNPPSCARCAVLAGRVYKWNEGFRRHPLCDCVHVPVESEESALAEGLFSDPIDAFEKGQVRGLSKADAQAISDGADMGRVINATRGTSAPGITRAYATTLHGHKVKATYDATTKRSRWRKANPTRLVRLRPESIYEFAKDREDAIRLLKLYGYIT